MEAWGQGTRLTLPDPSSQLLSNKRMPAANTTTSAASRVTESQRMNQS